MESYCLKIKKLNKTKRFMDVPCSKVGATGKKERDTHGWKPNMEMGIRVELNSVGSGSGQMDSLL
jgi:hypothetical protein